MTDDKDNKKSQIIFCRRPSPLNEIRCKQTSLLSRTTLSRQIKLLRTQKLRNENTDITYKISLDILFGNNK